MTQKIVVIPGDGIGPSIVEATLKVLEGLGCPFDYVSTNVGADALEKYGQLIPDEAIEAIETHKVALKGPVTTPIGEGFTSVNVGLRKKFDLYANVRPVVSFQGTRSRYENVDIIVIRENTEGIYSGKGQVMNDEGTRAETVSVITKEGAERVTRYAYELARQRGRRKVTVVHKANILKATSGLFLKTAHEVGANYPDIETEEMIIDNCCMQLVMNPERFDIVVTSNLFGDILSDLCAGLVGGLGLAPSANVGKELAIFEAVHGSAPDIAGKNIANPTAIMLAAAMMLDHLKMEDRAALLRRSLRTVIEEGAHKTVDLGGTASTDEFTAAVLDQIRAV